MNRLILFLSLLSLFPLVASAERISDYTVHVELTKSGVAVIQEEILYNFEDDQRHGIYREIPLVFVLPNKEERTIEITNLSVRGEGGKEHPFSVSGGGNFVEVKIGDPDSFVTGEVLYVVRYEVIGATFPSSAGSEFYWNAVGQDWKVPIDRVRLQVALPRTLPRDMVSYGCYKGSLKSTESCEEGFLEGVATNTITMLRFLAEELPPKSGVTFSVALPQDEMVVSVAKTKPSKQKLELGWVEIIKVIPLPLIVFLIMFRKWKMSGKDPMSSGTIVTEYEAPEQLDPLMLSFLPKIRITHEAITAMIIFLAQRGYLRIETKEDSIFLGLGKQTAVEFFNTRKRHDGLLDYEKLILDTIFSSGKDLVAASDLGRKLVILPQKVPGMLSVHATELGYYERDPQKIRNSYLLGGIGIIFVAFFLFFAPLLALSLLLTGVIITVLGWFMPKATQKGVEIIDRITGFKKYLTVAEKDSIAFHSDPKNSRAIYENLLPYAIALGLGSAWLKWFNSFYQNPDNQPVWISHHGASSFLAGDILASVESQILTSMTATSGGGGFSGGGGGGGGGGSW